MEVLFFDEGEEPDLSFDADYPEMSEVYVPGIYKREHLEPIASAMAKGSPRIRLHDAAGNPLPGVVYQVLTPGCQTDERKTDGEGWAYISSTSSPPDTVDVQWDKLDNGAFLYSRSLHVDCGVGPTNEAGKLRLHNLAYTGDLAQAVDRFQLDYGLARTPPTGGGTIDDVTLGKLDEIFAQRGCDATRPT